MLRLVQALQVARDPPETVPSTLCVHEHRDRASSRALESRENDRQLECRSTYNPEDSMRLNPALPDEAHQSDHYG